MNTSILKIIKVILFLNITFILPLPSFGDSFKTSIDKRKDDSISKINIPGEEITEKKINQENITPAKNLKTFVSFSAGLSSMKSEMFEIGENAKARTIDYLPPGEHDKIKNILFRYLVIRNALWGTVNYCRDFITNFTSPEKHK